MGQLCEYQLLSSKFHAPMSLMPECYNSAFKDVALQALGNFFEFFLVKRNKSKTGKDREHLTVIGATSGDTGAAAIYGLRSKKDVSVFIMYPTGKVSPVQEAQMTTVTDENGMYLISFRHS